MQFAAPGYDGGYGWKNERMPPMKKENGWLEGAHKEKKLFTEGFWRVFQFEQSEEFETKVDEVLKRNIGLQE